MTALPWVWVRFSRIPAKASSSPADGKDWVRWSDVAPKPGTPVETRCEGDDTIRMVIPQADTLTWNVDGVFWRELPPAKLGA